MAKLFGGGGSQTTTVEPAAPSPEELELQRLAIAMSQRQVAALDQAAGGQRQQQDLLNAQLGLGLNPVAPQFGGSGPVNPLVPGGAPAPAPVSAGPSQELLDAEEEVKQLERILSGAEFGLTGSVFQEDQLRRQLRDAQGKVQAARSAPQPAAAGQAGETSLSLPAPAQGAGGTTLALPAREGAVGGPVASDPLGFAGAGGRPAANAAGTLPTQSILGLRAKPAESEAFRRATEIGELTRQRELGSFERQGGLAATQDAVLQQLLGEFQGGTGATPEQRAQIALATDAALQAGQTDIERFETQALEKLRSELAPSLGLRPDDTPILDRGGRVSAEALRQRGQLSSQLRAGQAAAELNFPLAAGQLQLGRGTSIQGLSQSAEQFLQQLQLQAFQNRFAAQGLQQQGSLGLAGVPFTGGSALSTLSAGRGSTTTAPGKSNIAGTLGGLGGLLTGIGSIGAAGGFAKSIFG